MRKLLELRNLLIHAWRKRYLDWTTSVIGFQDFPSFCTLSLRNWFSFYPPFCLFSSHASIFFSFLLFCFIVFLTFSYSLHVTFLFCRSVFVFCFWLLILFCFLFCLDALTPICFCCLFHTLPLIGCMIWFFFKFSLVIVFPCAYVSSFVPFIYFL